MEDRSRRNGGLISTLAAHQETSCGCPASIRRALWTTKPGRPPQPGQISTTCTFCGETLLKLSEGPHSSPPRYDSAVLKGLLELSAHFVVRKIVQDGVGCQARQGTLPS